MLTAFLHYLCVNHHRITFFGVGILLVAALIISLELFSKDENNKNSNPADEGKAQTDRVSKRQSDLRERGNGGETERNGIEVVDSDSLTVSADRDAILEKMQDAATSYDPAELPVIRPYLESPDPVIRDAAVDAMIVLGDASAGRMLREAAKKMSSAEESSKMEKAADYVELPSASLKDIFKKRKENRVPSESE